MVKLTLIASGPGKNSPYKCTIFGGFEDFLLADELFVKALRMLETCVIVNKYLCGKLVPSLESPTTFDERFKDKMKDKVTSVPFTNSSTALFEKYKMFFFASTIIKDICVFPSCSRFSAKSICYIAFGSASSACLLKSIEISL